MSTNGPTLGLYIRSRRAYGLLIRLRDGEWAMLFAGDVVLVGECIKEGKC
jgi:hypothetical protein